jgi:TRAP-type mannitol/chloroaromatic compound transport system permease large subunit
VPGYEIINARRAIVPGKKRKQNIMKQLSPERMAYLQRAQDQARKYNAASKVWDRLFVGLLLTIIVLGSVMLGLLLPELSAAL